ncbi:hypothetical protein PS3A_14710 [Pseudomonas sp. 3A(2025)]
MSLSVGLPASFVAITSATSAGNTSPIDKQPDEAADALSRAFGDASAQPAKEAGTGLGKVVDTLVDRLADLHERLRKLRQELREALKSVQPDVVRLPRILSLQRQVMLTNSDIQLVSGLLITALNHPSTTLSTQV